MLILTNIYNRVTFPKNKKNKNTIKLGARQAVQRNT